MSTEESSPYMWEAPIGTGDNEGRRVAPVVPMNSRWKERLEALDFVPVTPVYTVFWPVEEALAWIRNSDPEGYYMIVKNMESPMEFVVVRVPPEELIKEGANR